MKRENIREKKRKNEKHAEKKTYRRGYIKYVRRLYTHITKTNKTSGVIKRSVVRLLKAASHARATRKNQIDSGRQVESSNSFSHLLVQI